MDPITLRDHLATLHEELRRVSSVDSGSSQLLGELMEDIKRLMPPVAATASVQSSARGDSTGSSAAASASVPDASLPDRLEKIAVQFEVDHPTLAASSRRLIDLLGKAGL